MRTRGTLHLTVPIDHQTELVALRRMAKRELRRLAQLREYRNPEEATTRSEQVIQVLLDQVLWSNVTEDEPAPLPGS